MFVNTNYCGKTRIFGIPPVEGQRLRNYTLSLAILTKLVLLATTLDGKLWNKIKEEQYIFLGTFRKTKVFRILTLINEQYNFIVIPGIVRHLFILIKRRIFFSFVAQYRRTFRNNGDLNSVSYVHLPKLITSFRVCLNVHVHYSAMRASFVNGG